MYIHQKLLITKYHPQMKKWEMLYQEDFLHAAIKI